MTPHTDKNYFFTFQKEFFNMTSDMEHHLNVADEMDPCSRAYTYRYVADIMCYVL